MTNLKKSVYKNLQEFIFDVNIILKKVKLKIENESILISALLKLFN